MYLKLKSLLCMFGLFVLFVSGGGNAFAATTSVDQMTTAGGIFESVSMLLPNGQEGWATGHNGLIMHTADGGANWAVQNMLAGVPSSAVLIDVYAVDASHVWAVGVEPNGGAPVMLFYNGTAWSSVALPNGIKKLMEVVMVSATQGYTVSRSGDVLKTTNGTAWSKLSVVMDPYGGGLNGQGQGIATPAGLTSIAVDPLNAQSVWVLSDGGVFHSTDGGANWGNELTRGNFQVFGKSLVDGNLFFNNKNAPIVFSGRTISAYGGTVVVGDWGQGSVWGNDPNSTNFDWIQTGGGIFSSQNGGSTWNYTPEIANNFLRPQMIDANVGYALDTESSDLNQIFKTTDGGLTWNPVARAGGIQWLMNLDFIDANTGWVVGSEQTISKIDLTAGTSVDQITTAGGIFESVSMLSGGQEGWATGHNGLIMHTVDGGANWGVQNMPAGVPASTVLIDVDAVDATHVWAVGVEPNAGAPVMLFYNGTAWSSVAAPAGVKKLMDVLMLSAIKGYAVSTSGQVLQTTNGSTWAQLSIVTDPYGGGSGVSSPAILTSIAVNPLDTQSVWVLTDGSGIFHSTDGGVSWGNELTRGAFQVNGSVLVDGSANTPIVFAGRTLSVYGGTIVAGDGGYIAGNDSNGNWVDSGAGILSSQNNGATWSYSPGIANNFLRPQMIDANVGFALDTETNDLNQIFKTIDGGLTWNPVARAGGIQWLINLDFIDANTGWVVGSEQTISKIDLTAGTSVDQITTAGGIFESVSMLSGGQEGWATGHKGLIMHTVDGGANWGVQNMPAGVPASTVLIDVDAVDATHVWAVGVEPNAGAPVMLFYNGTAWSSVALPNGIKKLMEVVMVSATQGYTVSRSGDVLQTTNGTAWSKLSVVMDPYGGGLNGQGQGIATPAGLTSIAVDPLNAQSVWVLSDGGVFHSTDGGATWGNELTRGNFQVFGKSLVDGNLLAFNNKNAPIVFSGRTISVYGGTVVVGDWGQGSVWGNDPNSTNFDWIQTGSGILSSQNGGSTWNYMPEIGGNFLRPQMIDASIGFALDTETNDLNQIFKTTDGGKSWNPVARAGGIQWLMNLDFIDANTGWVVGSEQTITKIDLAATTSGGSGAATPLTISGRITGVVTDATNDQYGTVQAIIVYINDANWNPVGDGYTVAAAGGSFSFANLSDGVYNIGAVLDTTGSMLSGGQNGFDALRHPVADFVGNPITITNGVVTDAAGNVLTSAAITVAHLGNNIFGNVTNNYSNAPVVVERGGLGFGTVWDRYTVSTGSGAYVIGGMNDSVNNYLRACVDVNSNGSCDIGEPVDQYATAIAVVSGAQAGGVNFNLTTSSLTVTQGYDMWFGTGSNANANANANAKWMQFDVQDPNQQAQSVTVTGGGFTTVTPMNFDSYSNRWSLQDVQATMPTSYTVAITNKDGTSASYSVQATGYVINKAAITKPTSGATVNGDIVINWTGTLQAGQIYRVQLVDKYSNWHDVTPYSGITGNSWTYKAGSQMNDGQVLVAGSVEVRVYIDELTAYGSNNSVVSSTISYNTGAAITTGTPEIVSVTLGTASTPVTVASGFTVAAPSVSWSSSSLAGVFVDGGQSSGNDTSTALPSFSGFGPTVTAAPSPMMGMAGAYGTALIQFSSSSLQTMLTGAQPINANPNVFGSATGPAVAQTAFSLVNAGIPAGTEVTFTVNLKGVVPQLVAIMGDHASPTANYDPTGFNGQGSLIVKTATFKNNNAAMQMFDSTVGFMFSADANMAPDSNVPTQPLGIIAQVDHWVGDIFPLLPGFDGYAAVAGNGGTKGASLTARCGTTINGPPGETRTITDFIADSSLAGYFGAGTVGKDLAIYVDSPSSSVQNPYGAVLTPGVTNFGTMTGTKIKVSYTFASPKDVAFGVASSVTGGGAIPSSTVKIHLQAGWNLIGMSVSDPNYSTPKAFASLVQSNGGQVLSIWDYADAGYWRNWDANNPVASDPSFTTLHAGKGYWVLLAPNAVNVTVNLTGQTSVAALQPGWNLVAPATTVTDLATYKPNSVSPATIWGYGNNMWESYIANAPAFLNSLKSMKLGSGYYVENKMIQGGAGI